MPNFIKKVLSVFVCGVFLVSSTGCSCFQPSTIPFSVVTNPEADIYINGQFLGKGSGTMNVSRDQSVNVMAKKDGYYPATQSVNTKMSTSGVWDVIGGFIFLLPFLGLLSPGARDLEVHSVTLNLAQQK